MGIAARMPNRPALTRCAAALGLATILGACAMGPRPDAPTAGGATTADGARDAATNLAPRPVPEGWLFSYRAPAGTRSVHLAGEFNGWSMTDWPLADDDGDGVWTRVAVLETGRAYQYKYVVNGAEWVTDPFAEATDPNNYNNGILFTRRPGEPYLTAVSPSDGGRYAAVPTLSAELKREGKTSGKVAARLTDLMGTASWTVDPVLDPSTGFLTADLPDDLPDGEFILHLDLAFADAPDLVKSIPFAVDRWQGTVDAPPFYDHAVMYEVFVRSFKDGAKGDGIGDFPGLTAMLDYLNDGDPATTNDLGVDAIWMMPIHPSPSYHGYDITDYEAIHPDFGTLDDYRAFVAEAHRRGLRVVQDFVVNHSSNRHPFFEDARGNPASSYSSWYKFTDPQNQAYDGFFGYGGMPEFDFRSRRMRDYLLDMTRFWMDLDDDGDYTDGVDAFRCDVAKGPPHGFWKELRGFTKGLRGDFMMLGEVWDSATTIASYFHSEFDMNFDYPLYYTLLDVLQGRKNGPAFFRDYEEQRLTYPAGAQLVRFLDNHDNNRIASVLGGDARRLRLATAVLFTLPGTPLVYYGMETGMLGVKPDPDLRKPMRWDFVEAQTGDPASLFSWHRDLIRLRREFPALTARDDAATRSLFALEASDPDLLAFERSAPSGGEAVILVANLTAESVRARLRAGEAPVTAGRLADVTPMAGRAGAGGAEAATGSNRAAPGTGSNRAEAATVDLNEGHWVTLDPYGVKIFSLSAE